MRTDNTALYGSAMVSLWKDEETHVYSDKQYCDRQKVSMYVHFKLAIVRRLVAKGKILETDLFHYGSRKQIAARVKRQSWD